MVTCAPIACKHKVSGSFSLPSRGPFHLSLTVLFAIGHWVVFRLGGVGPPASYRVSRVRYYSGAICVSLTFVYGSFTLFAMLFQNISTSLPESLPMVLNPGEQVLRFGLFPVRSPLLGKSMFLSLPRAT